MAAIHDLKVIRPTSEKCAVALPVRKPNAAYRSREHLTEREVERLIEAANDNRWGHRDTTYVADRLVLPAAMLQAVITWMLSCGDTSTTTSVIALF